MSEQAVSNIPNHVIALWNKNFGHDVQQMTARLRPYVTIETEEIPGLGKSYQDYDAPSNISKATTGRATPTRREDVSSSARWLFVEPYQRAHVAGRFDESTIGRITNPVSDFNTLINLARNRTADKRIIDAITEDVTVGASLKSTSTYSLQGDRIVAANFKYDTDGYTETTGSSMPLTVDKIRKALEIMGASEALGSGMASDTGEKPVIALRAKDKNALFAALVLTNTLYGPNTPYSDAVLEQVLGCRLIHTEQLNESSTNVIDVPLWLPSAIIFKEQNWQGFVDRLPGESQAVQVDLSGQMGALRRYDKKVAVIRVKK